MPYSAKLTRGANRTFFSIDFRHPVKKDRSGRYGLKVRRGLKTADQAEAERLVSQMNELLADETFHRPTAREAAAARGFSPVILDAFFRDLEPILNSGISDRERLLHLPTRAEGYAHILILGTTGSGKSTLVRQFLGTDPEDERFPSTAPGRVTVADQEFVLRPPGSDYEAVVSFLPEDLVLARVEDALADAALAHLQGRKQSEVARSMLAPREGRFRLSYVLGPLRNPDTPDSYSSIGSGYDHDAVEGKLVARESRVSEFIGRLTDIADRVGHAIAEQRSAPLADVFAGSDRDSVEQDVDAALRDEPAFVQLVDDVIDEISLRFEDVRLGEYEARAGDWPQSWRVRMRESERADFILALRPFTGIAAAQHGALLTPVVEGIRIAGPFRPRWWEDGHLSLVLIDGEGVGHNPETLRSLPGSVTDRIAIADAVLVVDSATQPMLEGPTLIARTLERLGESAKLFLCFTHVDEMRKAVNLPTLSDKFEHVRDAAREVFHHLAREFGRPRLTELERALEERTFFASGIDEIVRDEAGHEARFTNQELGRLAAALRYSPPQPVEHTEPEYDLDNVVIAIAAAASDYVETYRALLKLPSQRTVRPVAWQTAKAVTRYASQFGIDGYGTMRPAADFATMLGERLARFLATPMAFHPKNSTEQAKEMATARVRQCLAKRLDPWVRERLLAKPLPLWVRAYEHRGAGSTRLRALDVDVINLASVPPSSEEGDSEATQFRSEVKHLVVESIREGGGRVHAIQLLEAAAVS